ncbi:MAG: slipin family protein [Brevinematales bacterium]|jgi:regulator of protease activity HflC (stomatin/prohibitin superfamily)
MITYIYLAIFLVIVVFIVLKIVTEYERLVVFRLGKFYKVKGPGLVIIIPGIDRPVKVGLRTVTLDVPPQDVITKDNVSISVNAVVYFRIIHPEKAIIEVEDFMFATSQISQTTLRSVLGQSELDDLLAQREKINSRLQEIIDQATDPWGIKVSNVEVKDVVLPQEMKRAMAMQAEADRERRAKIIKADGELQASQKLLEAAKVMSQEKITIQLRYLQTLIEISNENATTIVFPVPMDLLDLFMKNKG